MQKYLPISLLTFMAAAVPAQAGQPHDEDSYTISASNNATARDAGIRQYCRQRAQRKSQSGLASQGGVKACEKFIGNKMRTEIAARKDRKTRLADKR